jgi:hypothetical protein
MSYQVDPCTAIRDQLRYTYLVLFELQQQQQQNIIRSTQFSTGRDRLTNENGRNTSSHTIPHRAAQRVRTKPDTTQQIR